MAEEVMIDGQVYRRRSPVAVALLTICTLFVYWVVWYYKVNKEMRRYLRDESIRPWRSLLAIVPGLLIVSPVVSIYRSGQRIEQMERKAGRAKPLRPGVGLFLAVLPGITLLFAGGTAYYFQTHLNAVWSAGAPEPPPDRGPLPQDI